MIKIIKRVLILLGLFTVLLYLFLAYHLSSNAPVTTQEVLRDDEDKQTDRAVETFIDIVEDSKTSYASRAAHAKGHGCVKAYFDVIKSIQPELQHGIFSVPGARYKAWIRLSNGRSSMHNHHDADRDSRGMAIKLFNINEVLSQEVTKGNDIQDFLMHSNPVFVSEDLEDFNQMAKYDNKLLYFLSGANPFKWRLRQLGHAIDTIAPPPYSPLWDDYHSNLPFKLGPHNIKFSTHACSEPDIDPTQDKSDRNFLRKTMVKELKTEAACFHFKVQLQDPDKYMPIEDPSIEWKKSDSPYITVAKITIPVQEFDTPEQQAFCENLSYKPWNALDAHRPIGQFNRIRKVVYAAASKYRHAENNTSIPTNLDW